MVPQCETSREICAEKSRTYYFKMHTNPLRTALFSK